MIRHKIISGTESDPIIWGLKTKFFYPFFASFVGGCFLCSFSFLALGYKALFLLLIFLIIIFNVYKRLKKKSVEKKHPESKKVILLSNKNLKDILK